MPVATVDFECEYDGELIRLTAGLDHVAVGHELARRFPHHFRPDPPAPHSRERQQPPHSAVRRSRASGLPEMRYRPRYQVAINEWAYRAINTEIGSGLEAGGVLLGTRAPDGSFLVSEASGPGGSLRTSHAIRHDMGHYARIEEAYAGTGVHALGIYHEHPAGTLEPSEIDLRSWTAASELADDGTFLGVIVASPEHPAAARMRIRAWTVIDGVCELANVVLDERSYR